MFKLKQVPLILALFCLCLAACAQSGSSSEGQTIVVTPAARGNSATLNVGDTLEVRLPTIPKEGFEWQPQGLDTTILVQEGSPEYTKDANPAAVGGIVTLRFTAVGSGSTNLNLVYASSLSGDAPSLSTHSFGMEVEVK